MINVLENIPAPSLVSVAFMPNTPFTRVPKIGRNDPCHCGSGRKFKKCHGRPEYALPNLVTQSRLEKQVFEEGRRLFEEHKARELQRQKQQGLGHPIISAEHKGYRFVAVGNVLYWGKWKTFYDFLGYYIRKTLGEDWGNAEIQKPLGDRHPVLQWYDRICYVQKQHAKHPGVVYSMPMTGAASAYNRLAYNLYLIAHNGKDVESRLIARLKNRDNFQGAFFETEVAAWVIKAGFELEYEDETDTSTSHCEFTAIYIKTGEKYSVEAKSRSPKPRGGAPRRLPVGRQLRQALEKKANHKRLVFIDLNKPLHTKVELDRVVDRAERILRLVETMQINGGPAPPAYVCLTNISDQYALDSAEIGTMVSFRGFKIRDFVDGEFASIREAIRARERHWPIFELLKSIEEHRDIPATFGGELPSEVFASGQPPKIRIGGVYLVPGPDGNEVPARITTATVMDGKAICGFHDPATDNAWLGTFEMTPEELADYHKYRDTYFGVHHPQGRRAETAVELFDFFCEAYQETPKEKLLELLAGASDIEWLRELGQKELVEMLCERYVLNEISHGFAVKQKRERN